MQNYNLFLDDERIPTDVFWKKEMEYAQHDWTIVRTAAQFIARIADSGTPSIVSFDNDIQDFTGQDGKEITGYDLAKILCLYCIDNDLKFPKVIAHSMNIVDQPKIEALFKNALRRHPHLA